MPCYDYTVSKQLSVSIIIPVYNEEKAIAACLNSIAMQSIAPLEVIVVNNNSTDATCEIAAAYSFVTIISEPRQGVVHARNAGFAAARGSIIGRIDADTRIASDWVETIQDLFNRHQHISALSGGIKYHSVKGRHFWNLSDAILRAYLAAALRQEMILQGANMAIRRSDWASITTDTCIASGIHEDFDLAIHLQQSKHKIMYAPTLKASICLRQVEHSWGEFTKYILYCSRTYATHGRIRRLWMYPALWLVIACYPMLRFSYKLHQGHASSRQQPSLGLRVNPATFVD